MSHKGRAINSTVRNGLRPDDQKVSKKKFFPSGKQLKHKPTGRIWTVKMHDNGGLRFQENDATFKDVSIFDTNIS